MDLSIIIPFAGEYPQILYTVASIHEELRDRGIEYQIICIDNDCPEWRSQLEINAAPESDAFVNQIDVKENRSRSNIALSAVAKHEPWLQVLTYSERLSHWQAKNVGVKATDSDYLWFCDAHCVVQRGQLYRMFDFYRHNYHTLGGIIHFANSYKLLEGHGLGYKLVDEMDEKGFLGYTLSRNWSKRVGVIEVPCASSCGMMLSREIVNDLKNDQTGDLWPQRYSYSGGEHFMNFAPVVMGYKHWLWLHGFLRHQGDKRDYHYTHWGMAWNRAAAVYVWGGEDMLIRYVETGGGVRPDKQKEMITQVVEHCQPWRDKVKDRTVVDIQEWVSKWLKEDE
jgi:glycosyltransferase involved in cell wall biosynthesis